MLPLAGIAVANASISLDLDLGTDYRYWSREGHCLVQELSAENKDTEFLYRAGRGA